MGLGDHERLAGGLVADGPGGQAGQRHGGHVGQHHRADQAPFPELAGRRRGELANRVETQIDELVEVGQLDDRARRHIDERAQGAAVIFVGLIGPESGIDLVEQRRAFFLERRAASGGTLLA